MAGDVAYHLILARRRWPEPGAGRLARGGLDLEQDVVLGEIAFTTDGIAEELTGEASDLTFAMTDSRLTITVSISKTNSEGTYVTQTVTGDVNVHR